MRRLKRWLLITTLSSSVLTTYAISTPSTRGALVFMNYCAGCHQLRYLSWPTMPPLKEGMALGTIHLTQPEKPEYWPTIGLTQAQAQSWFTRMPPDLSLVSQVRGSAWLKAYLLGFYADPSRPYGSSNHLIPQVMMPNVLYPVQQQLSPQDFEAVIDDIISFLNYTADPTQSLRHKLGYIVVSFFTLCSLLLGWLFCIERPIRNK